MICPGSLHPCVLVHPEWLRPSYNFPLVCSRCYVQHAYRTETEVFPWMKGAPFQFASMRATTSELSTSARARLNVLRIEQRCRQLSSQAPWTLRRPQNSQPLRRRRSPSVQGPKFIDIDLFFNGKDLPIVNRIGEKSEKLCSKFRRKHRQCLRFFLVGSGAKGRKSCRSRKMLRMSIYFHELSPI